MITLHHAQPPVHEDPARAIFAEFDRRHDRPRVDDDPAISDVEWLDDQAVRYRALGTDAALLLAQAAERIVARMAAAGAWQAADLGALERDADLARAGEGGAL